MQIKAYANSRPKILIVDDIAANRHLLKCYLKDLDIVIEEVSSGNECLKILHENDYSLVCLDISMPEMDGYQVLKLMREDKKLQDIPVIFISAVYDSEEYIIRGINSGAVDFIAKPINSSILQSKVSLHIKMYEKQKKLNKLVKKHTRANQQLRENELKFKRITQSANDAIVVIDSDYKIKFSNNATFDIFGYGKYELVSESLMDLFMPEKSQTILKKHMKSLIKSETSHSNSIRLTARNKSGVEFPVELSLAMFSPIEKAINFTLIIRNITHRVKIENEALKAKELREANKTRCY